MEYIYEYFLEIVECKFARNGLTNWKTFLTNILRILFGIFLLVNPIKLWKSLYPSVHTRLRVGESQFRRLISSYKRKPFVFPDILYEKNIHLFYISIFKFFQFERDYSIRFSFANLASSETRTRCRLMSSTSGWRTTASAGTTGSSASP